MVSVLNALLIFTLWMLAIYCGVVLFWISRWILQDNRRDSNFDD